MIGRSSQTGSGLSFREQSLSDSTVRFLNLPQRLPPPLYMRLLSGIVDLEYIPQRSWNVFRSLREFRAFRCFRAEGPLADLTHTRSPAEIPVGTSLRLSQGGKLGKSRDSPFVAPLSPFVPLFFGSFSFPRLYATTLFWRLKTAGRDPHKRVEPWPTWKRVS